MRKNLNIIMKEIISISVLLFGLFITLLLNLIDVSFEMNHHISMAWHFEEVINGSMMFVFITFISFLFIYFILDSSVTPIIKKERIIMTNFVATLIAAFIIIIPIMLISTNWGLKQTQVWSIILSVVLGSIVLSFIPFTIMFSIKLSSLLKKYNN